MMYGDLATSDIETGYSEYEYQDSFSDWSLEPVFSYEHLNYGIDSVSAIKKLESYFMQLKT